MCSPLVSSADCSPVAGGLCNNRGDVRILPLPCGGQRSDDSRLRPRQGEGGRSQNISPASSASIWAPTFTREWTPRSSAIRPLPTIRSTMAACRPTAWRCSTPIPARSTGNLAAGPRWGGRKGNWIGLFRPATTAWLAGGSAKARASPSRSPRYGAARRPAQRVRAAGPGQGIAQWIFLPLHRVRKYEIEILGRSADVSELSAALFAQGLAAFRNGNHARAVGPMERAARFAGGRCPVAGRRRLPAGDYGRFAWPVRRRSRTLAARRSHRQGRSGHRAVVEARGGCRCCVGRAETSSAPITGKMASGRPMLVRPCPTMPGAAWRRTSSGPTSSWISAPRWAASR